MHLLQVTGSVHGSFDSRNALHDAAILCEGCADVLISLKGHWRQAAGPCPAALRRSLQALAVECMRQCCMSRLACTIHCMCCFVAGLQHAPFSQVTGFNVNEPGHAPVM